MKNTESPRSERDGGPRKKRRLPRLVLVLIVSLVVAAAALEGVVRVFNPLGVSHFSDMARYIPELCDAVGPPRILRHRPSTTVRFRDFEISTNRLGLRGPELPEPKPDGEYRILFLGDSVVLGWGAAYEDLFTTLVEQRLNGPEAGTVRYRTVNTGHNRYDTTQEAALLEELGDRIDPDAVLLVYVNNDVDPTVRLWEQFVKAKETLEQEPPSAVKRAKDRAVQGFLALFQGLHNLSTLLFHVRDLAREVNDIKAREARVDAEGWSASRDALLRIRGWCRSRGIPFAVLNHTFPGDGERPAEIPPLVPFLEGEGILCFPFHFTAEEMTRPIRNSFSDAHANALGHRLLLEKTLPALRHLGIEVP